MLFEFTLLKQLSMKLSTLYLGKYSFLDLLYQEKPKQESLIIGWINQEPSIIGWINQELLIIIG